MEHYGVECLLGEATTTLMERFDIDPPELRAPIGAAPQSRRLGQELLARQQELARPVDRSASIACSSTGWR